MRGIDLTPAQIENLVSAYLAGGLAGSEKLAAEYCVNRKYPYLLAKGRGLRYGPAVPQRKLSKPEEDRRWQWAIERGPVVA